MNGLELMLLGHKLSAIGLAAMPHGRLHRLPVNVRTILVDVFEYPGSSIKEITERTGFPQSMVSATVAEFKDKGLLATATDSGDRRRTLVRPAPGKAEQGLKDADATTVDDTLAATLRDTDARELSQIMAVLEVLVRRLVTPRD